MNPGDKPVLSVLVIAKNNLEDFYCCPLQCVIGSVIRYLFCEILVTPPS